MSGLDQQRDLAVAVWRTWGAKGLARRVAYEGTRRTGRARAGEDRWLDGSADVPLEPLRRAGIVVPPGATPPEARAVDPAAGIRLYGALDLPISFPPDWHTHPLTGHHFDPAAHWSSFSDAAPEAGDIKDQWEPSRFGWLQPWLRRWATTGDDAAAEQVWLVVEDWHARNPPYLGPNWMCGQETSLRTISAMFLADALAGSPASTPARQLLVAAMVRDAVGRVAPTLGYALSQRNNHASSEAGFLWTAAVLAPWLPDAPRQQRRAARALTEAVVDQFGPDGSYAQHSPTYQRVALHVLLWCLAVSRATGEPAPDGVADAVRRSVPHLRSLVVPDSGGQVPNLGGNDGALVFALTPATIGDLRPVIAHAAAATGQASGLGPGPWDEEAAWFGLTPPVAPLRAGPAARNTHALTRGDAHVVLRAGRLGRRPAHADQFHVDVWLDGAPVAVDPGSYRYTAPDPWGNALAGEDVHNLPTRAGSPQAVKSGRFFWRQWHEADVVGALATAEVTAVAARLDLADGTRLHRLVAVRDGLVLVVDRASALVTVRWNLPADAAVEAVTAGAASGTEGTGGTEASGPGWRARFAHGGAATVPERSDDDPASGWHAPTYGTRQPLTALLLPSGPGGLVVSVFASTAASTGAGIDAGIDLGRIVARATAVDVTRLDRAALERLLPG